MSAASGKKTTAEERTVPMFDGASPDRAPRRYRVKPSRILWKQVLGAPFDWYATFDKKTGEREVHIRALKPDGFAIGELRFDTLSEAIAWVERRVAP